VSGFFSISREWAGETAFLLGGGPSLCGFDAGVLRGRGRVIAINNSYLLCPGAEVLYFCDRSWWLAHQAAIAEVFPGRILTTAAVEDARVLRLRNTGHSGLETSADGVRHGCNSGYQAINVAYHFGAARIVLLGYDLRVNGRTHWHAGHAGVTAEMIAHNLKVNMLPRFPSLVAPLAAVGVEVINATPDSALKCWPYRPLAEILETCESC
jgi:hypothetical protein